MDTNLSFLQEGKVYNVDLGSTFRKRKDTAFHTVRYDFKPASVDLTQQGEVNVGETNDVGETNVSITLPHQQGSKNSSTFYKGSKKPAQKECVLIFDKETGSFTLERISSQIQVKKMRLAGNISAQPPVLPSSAPVKLNKKSTKKAATSKAPKPPVVESRKTEFEDKPEMSQPVKMPITQPLEDEPPVKRPTLSASSSSGDNSSSSDSSSSDDDDDSSSSDASSNKSPSGPIKSSLLEDLELSETDSD